MRKNYCSVHVFNVTAFSVVMLVFAAVFSIAAKCHNIPTRSDQKWQRSQKADGIETYYRVEKMGTDKFEVGVKVHNTRSRPIEVTVFVEYKLTKEMEEKLKIFERIRQLPFAPLQREPDATRDKSTNECTLTVQPNSSAVCEAIEIEAEKIKGVRIKHWNVID